MTNQDSNLPLIPLHQAVFSEKPSQEQINTSLLSKNVLATPNTESTNTTTDKNLQELADQNINFVSPEVTWKQQAAQNQGWLEQLYNTTHQVAVGHGIGGTIAGIGYLENLAKGSTIANNYDNEFSNSITELGNSILENSMDSHPIYEVKPGEFNPGDFGYWMGRTADMGSMLSMLIPTGAVVKGIGLAAKGLTLASRLSKAANATGLGAKYAQYALKGVGSAIISRQIESSMEADGIFKEQYDRYKSLGFSELEAKSAASQAASSTYRGNWAMLVQDIPQYLLMGSKWNPSVTKAASAGTKNILNGVKNIALDSLGEGAEEGYQYLLGQESKAQSDIDSGLASADFGRSYRLKKNVKDTEFLNSVISGMFGSTVMQGGNSIAAKLLGKDSEEKSINDLKIENSKTFSSQLAEINAKIKNADINNDVEASGFFRRELNATMALRSASLGNIDHNVEFLEGLEAMSEEQMEVFNANNGTDYNLEFKNQLPQLIQDTKRLGELYNEGYRKYGNNAALYAQSKFDIETKDDTRRRLDGEIASLISTMPQMQDLSSAGQIIAQSTQTISTIKSANKQLKKLKASGNLTEDRLKSIDEVIEKNNQDISKAEETLKESKQIERSEEERINDDKILSSLNNNQELNDKVVKRNSLDLDVKNAVSNLSKLEKNPSIIEENKINNKIDQAESINELEEIASTLPVDEYESTKEFYRTKLESKYSELKQKEDNQKRDNISEVISQNKEVIVPNNTTEEVDENTFKQNVDIDSDFNHLLIKQGTNVNYLDLKNGDSVSIEDPSEVGVIVFGKINNNEIIPDFVFYKPEQLYVKKQVDGWYVDDQKVDEESIITDSLDDIYKDSIEWNSYHVQRFTPYQAQEILKSVYPSSTSITQDINNDINNIAITYSPETYDIEEIPNLSGVRAAYKSYRGDNPTSDLFQGYKKEFTDLIETPVSLSEKMETEVIMYIDTDYIKSQKNSENILADINSDKDINVSDIPVKIIVKGKDGKDYTTFLYTGSTLSKQGYNTSEQLDKLISLKKSILDAYRKGSGFIKTDINFISGGVFAKTLPTFENVPASLSQDISEIQLRISSDNYYLDNEGKDDLDFNSAPKNKGNVYTKQRDTAGNYIPVKLWNTKLTDELANIVVGIYKELGSKKRSENISSEFISAYKSPVLDDLLKVLNKSTYQELLSNLVYEGKKETQTYKLPLYLSDDVLTYGSTKVKIENLDVDNFKDYLTSNHYLQINRKLINNNDYKSWLFNNNFLKINHQAVDGNLFIQPVLSFSTDIRPQFKEGIKVEPLPSSLEDETKPTTTVREDLEESTMFDSTNIAPTKADVINEQEAINWLRDKLGNIPIEIQDDVIEIFKDGTQSIGRFTEGMIILSRSARSGTEYHEAFHAVSNLYLKENQRQELYNIVRKSEGKNLTDRQAEELLADEFEYYVKTDGKADYKYVNNSPTTFFGKLLQLIKSIFNNSITVDSVFKNINSGYYKNKPLSKDIKVESYDKRVDNLSVEQTKNITDVLTYFAFATQDLGAIDISNLDFNKGVIELFKIYNKSDDSYKARFERVFDSLVRSDWRTIYNNKNIDIKSVDWIDHKSSLATNLYENLQTLGIKVKISKKTNEELLDDVRLDENNDDNYTPLTTKASYSYSNKETSRNSTKLLVANLPAIKEFKDGKPVYEVDDFFNLPKIADYNNTWSFLEDLLSNIFPSENQDGLEIMLARINESLEFRPELKKLYDNLIKASDTVKTQFYTDMNLVKNNFATTLVTKTYDASTESNKYTYKFQKGNEKNITKRIISEWSDLFNNKFMTEGKVDTSKFVSVTNRLDEIDNRLKSFLSDSELKTLISDLYNVLSDLGFQFTSVNSLNYTINSIPSKDLRGKVTAFLLSSNYGIIKAIERISLGQNPADVLTDEKGIIFLLKSESKFRRDGFESSIVGAEGNKQWSYSYGNFFNKVVNNLSGPKPLDNSYFNKLKSTPYFQNSVWYNQLINGEVGGSSISSSIFSSLKQENVGDSGSALTDLAPNEEKSDIINRIIANIDKDNRTSYSTGLAKADKSTDVLISGFKLKHANYINNKLGNTGTDILIGYLESELMRTIEAHNQVDSYKQNNNESDLIEYYHYDPKSKDKFNKSGGAFRCFLFPELSSSILKDSNKELYNLIYDENGKPFPITDDFKSNQTLRDYINQSFSSVLNFEIKEAIKIGVVKQSETGLANISLDNNLVNGRINHYGSEDLAVTTLMADYVLNGIINNVETTKFFHGDPALYKGNIKDPFADIKKRTPLILATGRSLRVYKDNNDNWIVPPTYTSAVLEDSEVESYFYSNEYIDNLSSIYSEINRTSLEFEKERLGSLFSAYKSVNETDAQAYITLDRYRITQLGWGKWTDAKQEAYNAIKEWQSNPTKENLKLAQSLSLSSELAMQPLKSVHTGMEFYDSNPGVGIIEYNKQSEAILNPVFTVNTPLDKLRLSMEGVVDHVIFRSGKKVGTQGPTTISSNGNINDSIKFNKIKNLSNNNYYLQQDLPYHGFEESLEGSQIFNVVQSDIDFNYIYSNGLTGRELVSELQKTQAKLHEIGGQELRNKFSFSKDWNESNYLQLRKQMMEDITKRGASDNLREALQDSSFPFSGIAQAGKRISNMFNSMVNSFGVKLKMPGGPLIQISGFGIARPTSYSSLDKSSKEGILWLTSNKQLSPPKLTRDEAGNIIHLKGQILVPHNIIESIEGWENMSQSTLLSKIDKDVLTAIGYRIPNQGLSSNDSLEIVGILPIECGDSVVLYNEVTTKTGADFDIDKMYIMVPNYTFNNKSGRIEKVIYDEANPTKEGLQNHKLDLYSTLLSDPKSYLSVVAPLDSPFLKDTITELHGETKVENRDLFFMSPGQQYNIKTSFRGGKTGIGILANNIVDHSQAQQFDLKLNGINLGRGNISPEGETVFSGKYCEGEENFKISSVLSWFANAFVDIAKDPYITKGNFNDTTLSTTMMLVRAGIDPKWIIGFMGQPILKDYVELVNSNKGRIKDYTNIKNVLLNKYDTEDIRKVDLNISYSELENSIKNPDTVENFNATQLGILELFLNLDRSAKRLQEQIRASKQNTNGAGKSNIETFTSTQLVAKIRHENKIGNFDNKFKGTALGSAYKNSIKLLQEMFGNFLFSDNSVNIEAMSEIFKEQGNLFATDLDLNTKVSGELYSYVSSGLPFFRDTDLKSLLFGNNSIASRVYELKYNSKSPVKNNLLIQYLEVQKPIGSNPGTIGINQFRDKSVSIQNQLSQSWEELLNNENPKIRQGAEDMVKYAFWSSGFNSTSKSFFEYIPYKYLKQIGFGEYMDEFMKNPDNGIIDSFKEQFYQNNLDIVQDVSKKDFRNNKGIYKIEEKSLPKYVIGYSLINGETQVEYYRYLKQDKNLFKLQGYDHNNNPLYTLVQTKGFEAESGSRFKEYSYGINKESIFNNKITPVKVNISSLPQTPNSLENNDSIIEDKFILVDNSNPVKLVERIVLSEKENQNINDLKSITNEYKIFSNEDIQYAINKLIPNSTVKEVVFHGTNKKFNEYTIKGDFGFHFGTKKAAEARLEQKFREDTAQDVYYVPEDVLRSEYNFIIKPNIINLTNPLRVSDSSHFSKTSKLDTFLEKNIITKEEYDYINKLYPEMDQPSEVGGMNEYFDILENYQNNPKVISANKEYEKIIEEKLLKLNYDGLIYTNEHEDRGNDSYIVFNNNNIIILDSIETISKITSIINNKNNVTLQEPTEDVDPENDKACL